MATKSSRSAARPTSPARTANKPAPKPIAKRSAASAQRPTVKAVAATVQVSSGSKQSRLIALLRSPSGGTMDQMIQLTGWQPHTVRGAISGALRKKLKLNVTCVEHVYRIAEGQA